MVEGHCSSRLLVTDTSGHGGREREGGPRLLDGSRCTSQDFPSRPHWSGGVREERRDHITGVLTTTYPSVVRTCIQPSPTEHTGTTGRLKSEKDHWGYGKWPRYKGFQDLLPPWSGPQPSVTGPGPSGSGHTATTPSQTDTTTLPYGP